MFYITYREARSLTGFGSSLVSTREGLDYMLRTREVLSVEVRSMDNLPVFTPPVMAALNKGSVSL